MTRYNYTLTLTSAFHHGAGTAGNTSLLRTQEVVHPDTGATSRIPFLSGNSIRHKLREGFAWHTIRKLGIEERSLTKPVVDLLFSGGAVTRTGSETDLELPRRIDELLPWLGLLGYAAGSSITAGTLRVSDAILVCAENAWRLPTDLQDAKPAAAYRSEEFGTRHDIATTPAARMIEIAADTIGTTQMIYDRQTLKPGAQLAGSMWLTPAATPQQESWLGFGTDLFMTDGQESSYGALNAQGYGTAITTWSETIDAREASRLGEKSEVLALLEDLAK